MNKYRVTYVYRSRVVVDVEAENEECARIAGMEEADDLIDNNIELDDVTVKQIK